MIAEAMIAFLATLMPAQESPTGFTTEENFDELVYVEEEEYLEDSEEELALNDEIVLEEDEELYDEE